MHLECQKSHFIVVLPVDTVPVGWLVLVSTTQLSGPLDNDQDSHSLASGSPARQ